MKGIVKIAAVIYEISVDNREKWEQFLFMHGKRLYDGIYYYCGHYYFECFDMWFRADTMQGDDFDPLALAKAFGHEYNVKPLHEIFYFDFGDGLTAYFPKDVYDTTIRW